MSKEEGNFWIDEENRELVLSHEGQEERFYIDEELNMDDNRYLVLVPAEENGEEGEALVLKLVKDGEEDILTIIENDDEFEKVKNAYLAS